MTTIYKSFIGKEDVEQWDGVNPTFSRRTSTGGTATMHALGEAVDVAGVYGDGNPSWGALQSAVSLIGSNKARLVLCPGTWTTSADLTIPSNLTLNVPPGAVITQGGAHTLTINGRIEAGRYAIFSGFTAGQVTFGSGAAEWLRSEWGTCISSALVLMRATSDPYPAATASPPTHDQNVIEQLKYLLAQITGKAYWYIDPDSNIATMAAEITALNTSRAATKPVNLILKNNASHPDHQVDISATDMEVHNTTMVPIRLQNVSETVDIIGATGAGHLDAGSAANVWYSVWIIYDPNTSTVSSILSANMNAYSIPGDYYYYHRVGFVKRTAGAFLNFVQVGDTYQFEDVVNVKTNGTDTSMTALDLALAVPSVATTGIKAVFFNVTAVGGAAQAQLSNNNTYIQAKAVLGAASYTAGLTLLCLPDNYCYYSTSANGITIDVQGFIIE